MCPRHRDAGRVRPEHHQVVAGPHEKQVGRRPAQEDATVAVEHPVAQGEGPAPTERGHAGAVRQSGEQRHLLGVVATVGDHRRGQHRREEGPWRDLTAQLLQHDDELAQPRTCATVLLGEVDAEPTERRHLVPEGRPRLDVGLEQRPVGRDGAMRDEHAADGGTQLLVLVGDGDRHTCPLVLQPGGRRLRLLKLVRHSPRRALP